MKDNPYTPGSIASNPKSRASGRLLWAGFAFLALAALCIVVTVIGMIWSSDALAKSSTTPKPADLATGISNAMIPSIVAVPLSIAGVTLLMVGLIRRKPIDSA